MKRRLRGKSSRHGISQVSSQLDLDNFIASVRCNFDKVENLNQAIRQVAVKQKAKAADIKDNYKYDVATGIFSRLNNFSLKTEYDKMKREFIHITDNNKHRLMSDSGFWHGSTNENSRDKMKKILSMAVLNELTERQRICIVDYYLNGKKEKEIAKELGVNSSTVSRHIMKARDKLRHIASYYVN